MNAIAGPRTRLWTGHDVATATDGAPTSAADWSAGGVSIDSRTIEPGDLFIAIVGPKVDGHDHVAGALAAGAAGCVVARVPDGVGGDAPLILVGDTLDALQDLARASRARSAASVAAVTGSVGKTSTKEMLKLAFEAQSGGSARVAATVGNLNNHWGLPLSLARMPAETAYGVFEMGMNHAGEIEPLSRIARPDVALITSIEPVHIEFFESLDGIADAKAEIFAGVASGGAAVIDRDGIYFERLSARAREAGIERIVTFGEGDADVRGVDIECEAEHSIIEADIGGRRISYALRAPGRHLARNSLAVLAVLHALGADVDAGAKALKAFRAGAGRGGQSRVDVDGGSFLLIDESYNASPASMRAAMAVAGLVEPEGEGRRIAVLGDMLELGVETEAAHAGLFDAIRENGFDRVYCAGPRMQGLWNLLPDSLKGAHDDDPERVAEIVAGIVRPDDVVMVKGSLGSRVGLVVKRLTSAGKA